MTGARCGSRMDHLEEDLDLRREAETNGKPYSELDNRGGIVTRYPAGSKHGEGLKVWVVAATIRDAPWRVYA